MTPNVAKCLLVSRVLVADGMMQDEERQYLETIMDNLELNADERISVIELEGLDEADTYVKALPLEERQTLLEMLVDAASADGKLSQYEMGAVTRLKKMLGL